MPCVHFAYPHCYFQAVHRKRLLELDHGHCEYWITSMLLLLSPVWEPTMGRRCSLASNQRRILAHRKEWQRMGPPYSNASRGSSPRHHLSSLPENLFPDANRRCDAEAVEGPRLCIRWIRRRLHSAAPRKNVEKV